MNLSDLTSFEKKWGGFIHLIVYPILFFIFTGTVMLSNFWLRDNFTPRQEFLQYIEEQKVTTSEQNRTTNAKLEIIILNQGIYTEQLKGLNNLISQQQNQHNSLSERVMYLERRK